MTEARKNLFIQPDLHKLESPQEKLPFDTILEGTKDIKRNSKYT